MNENTKIKLYKIWQECDDNNKSSGYMLELMKEKTKLQYDTIMMFIRNSTQKERLKYNKHIFGNKLCSAGCKSYDSGEIKHDRNCVFYKGSLSEKYDLIQDAIAKYNGKHSCRYYQYQQCCCADVKGHKCKSIISTECKHFNFG